MIKSFVLDSTAFCEAKVLPKGKLIYPAQVADELKSSSAKLKADLSKAKPVVVKKDFLKMAESARQKTGDSISATDIAVIACALQEKAIVTSDDYGVQNVASYLKLELCPLTHRGISHQWNYEYFCQGCGKKYLKTGVCPDCGGRIKRKKV